MNKNSDRANQPMLPIVRDNDSDALQSSDDGFFMNLACVSNVSNIFPAAESGGINQQSDLPVLANQRIDLRRNFADVFIFQILRIVIFNALAEMISVLINQASLRG